MLVMGEVSVLGVRAPTFVLTSIHSIAYMINENSIQFNIISKRLGCERMSFYLNEAASDIRDLMMPTLEAPKAKL